MTNDERRTTNRASTSSLVKGEPWNELRAASQSGSALRWVALRSVLGRPPRGRALRDDRRLHHQAAGAPRDGRAAVRDLHLDDLAIRARSHDDPDAVEGAQPA